MQYYKINTIYGGTHVCITNCTDYKSQVLVGEVVNIEGLKVGI